MCTVLTALHYIAIKCGDVYNIIHYLYYLKNNKAKEETKKRKNKQENKSTLSVMKREKMYLFAP